MGIFFWVVVITIFVLISIYSAATVLKGSQSVAVKNSASIGFFVALLYFPWLGALIAKQSLGNTFFALAVVLALSMMFISYRIIKSHMTSSVKMGGTILLILDVSWRALLITGVVAVITMKATLFFLD